MRGQISAWYQRLHGIRTHAKTPRDLSFRDFLTELSQEAKDKQPLTPERVFTELGFDWGTITFQELANDQEGFFLAAELVREAIDRGMRGVTLRQQRQRETMLRAIYSQAPVTTDPSARYLQPEYYAPPIMRGVVQAQYW
ncbi:MAG TPA: hypothetical protein PKD31_26410, partial [Blastocatellia bacterium]|nr:hypothetical protein [Blastocatellia bacterium]